MQAVTSLEHLNQVNPSFLMATAEWCKGCLAIKKEIGNQYAEILYTFDVDEAEDIADKYDIKQLPTFIRVQDSKTMSSIDLEEIKHFIQKEKSK